MEEHNKTVAEKEEAEIIVLDKGVDPEGGVIVGMRCCWGPFFPVSL